MDCNLAVTGLNATDNPAPGIAVVRSIRCSNEWKGKIIGLAYDALDTGIYDPDILDKVYLIPYPTEGEGTLLARLREIIERTNLQVIIPNLDSELLNFSRLSCELGDLGVKMLIPGEDLIKLRSKISLVSFCNKKGFLVPRVMIINDPEQIEKAAKEIGLPMVVKGIFHGAELASSLDDIRVYFSKIKSQWGIPIILQEYILGEEYDVVLLGSREGKCMGALAMRKLRITEKGKAWAGIAIRDEELLSLARTILERLSWVGPMEIEFLKESYTRKYYCMEINPRFPSWVYLAAKAGCNLPLATVELAMGYQVDPLDSYEVGLTFVRHATDLVCPLKYLEELTIKGELTFNGKT